MSDTDTATKTSEETEKTEPEQKEDEKWSKEKQRADQAEANYKKLVTERDEIFSQLSTRDEKITALEQKMADLAEAKEVPIEDLLDPDLVDAKTIKTVSKMAKQIRDQEKSIKKLTDLADGFQKKAKDDKVKTEKDKTIEKILKPLDEEFGAKFRNSSKKLADSLVDEGKERQPQDVIEAMALMRKCYKIKQKEAEDKKETVQTDSGSSSVSFDDSLKDKKTGGRREILAEMHKGLNLFGKSK